MQLRLPLLSMISACLAGALASRGPASSDKSYHDAPNNDDILPQNLTLTALVGKDGHSGLE
jgi:hypothetical protein